MSFQGLDPERVKQTADALERQASALDSVASHVDGLIRTAMHHWSGPEAQDFHQWWVGQHRPRLVAAGQGLHGAAQNVRRQVAEQEHASGGQAGSGGGTGLGSVGRWWQRVDAANGLLGAVGAFASGGAYLLGHQLVGAYPRGTPQILHWKTSPVIQRAQSLLKSNPLASRYLPGVAKDISRIDKPMAAISALSAGVHGYAAGTELAHGQYLDGGLDSASALASAAKASKNPVTYLAGAATQAWVEVGKAAEKTDWSAEGFSGALDEYRRDPWGTIGAGLKADVDFIPGQLMRIFG